MGKHQNIEEYKNYNGSCVLSGRRYSWYAGTCAQAIKPYVIVSMATTRDILLDKLESTYNGFIETDAGKLRSYNPVNHIRHTRKHTFTDVEECFSGLPHYGGEVIKLTAKYAVGASPLTLESAAPELFTPVNSSLLMRSWDDMMSDESLLGVEGVSIPNMLLELRDLRRIVDLFNFHRPIGQEIADKYLGVSFGVLPLANDIKNIYKIATQLDSFIDRWNEQAYKKSVLAKHSILLDIESSFDKDISSEDARVYFTQSYKGEGTRKSILSVYFVPNTFPDSLRFDMKRRLYGFKDLASIVWEAVPFSWAIDYFTNIGELISQWERDPQLLRFEVVGAGYSDKIIGNANASASVSWKKKTEFPTAHVVESINNYSRYTLDNFPPVARSGSFEFKLSAGVKQWSYIGAVGLQKLYSK